jgi:hypothetical protein
MFFGGMNGFNAFYPDRIQDNRHVPPVVLTGFRMFNEPVRAASPDDPSGRGSPLRKHISETEEIRLSHRDNVISFEFVALNYSSPERNQYAYKLEGFDEDWVYSDTRHDATYTNLDPGAYLFRVKGSNNDGIWNEEGASIRLIITPPFWATWWFRISTLSALAGLAWVGYRRRIDKLDAQKRGLERVVAERTTDLSAANQQLTRRFLEAELLHHAVELGAESDSFHEALQRIVEKVCQMTDWPVGHVYEPSPVNPDELVPTNIWHLANPGKYSVFREVTERTKFSKGVGLPGRILKSGEPAWIKNVEVDPNFPRTKLAENLGVKGAFGFPVKVGGDVVAVLEFFADTEMAPDQRV